MATTAARLQKVQDRIDALIDGSAVAKYSSDGDSLEHYSIDELQRLETRLEKKLAQENANASVTGNRAFARFGRPA